MPKSKSEMLAKAAAAGLQRPPAVSVFAAELVAQLNRIHQRHAAKVAAVAAGCGAYEQGKLVGLANGLVVAMELVGELERVGLWREMHASETCGRDGSDGESERGTAEGAVLPQAGPAVHR